MKPFFKATEHSESEYKCDFTVDQIKDLNSCFYDQYGKEKPMPDFKYLGIHEVDIYSDGLKSKVIKSYYYIGYKWLDNNCKNYIRVSPKYNSPKTKEHQADYLKMFLECLDDPIVSKSMGQIYEINFDEKWIEVEEEQDEITPLIVLHFLKIVKQISRRGLKKGYMKITENLTSKVKGKILINQTIKHNHFKNRLDKTVCKHQIFTSNCLENQIIKTALMQCNRHLRAIKTDEISKLIRQNINAFELVDTKEVFTNDFSRIKHSPFYKEYQDALKLAKMIFQRFGFTLNSPIKDYVYKIPPFHINMPELFERYVEVQLRKKYNDLIDGNKKKYTWEMRPDFLLPSKNMIIDAKYKYWIDNNTSRDRKDDYLQLSLYARENKILEDINIEENKLAEILFIYPSASIIDKCEVNVDDKVDDNENFKHFYKLGIYMPKVGIS